MISTLWPLHRSPGLLAFALLLGLARPGAFGEVASVPEIGTHHPILIVEKNVNPQNKLVIYTKVDSHGRFQAAPKNAAQPVFDFYWLMSGTSYKPVNGRIKSEIRQRFESQWLTDEDPNRFVINVHDLQRVNSDIANPKVEVFARTTDGRPRVEAEMTLGPSDGHKRIRLSSIYTVGRVLPPAVHSVTLKGEEIVNGRLTGRPVSRTYEARR